MTARERKIARLKRLISEINEDLRAIDQIAGKARALLEEVNARTGPVPDRDLMAMAAYLHHFYTGVESMFERISRQIDGGPVKAGDWHRELLRSMAVELEGLRPGVISRELMEELDEYRRFRHLFRHAYAGELRWMKMCHLAENMGDILGLLKGKMDQFKTFVTGVIEELEKNIE
ncbi:hypothetical protein Desku_1801 [Desulfofundulus kuznetsovii DSM 6115]|uniref:HepT-like domain-containing protein n=1 Tax=Desulfofundulus kuznetsovii (strain DSM 6115 / VKM B-1805 / 17) TaxID=760568 RepID=A0AAU8PZ13_DESK7|nr:hypothetical protein Desku_1801 [Desulfofundulus kuznetsovii DSM 6115]